MSEAPNLIFHSPARRSALLQWSTEMLRGGDGVWFCQWAAALGLCGGKGRLREQGGSLERPPQTNIHQRLGFPGIRIRTVRLEIVHPFCCSANAS